MNKKYIFLISILFFPTIATSCSSNSTYSTKEIVEIIKNKPEQIQISSTQTEDTKWVEDVNQQIYTDYFVKDKTLVQKELIYDSFHFINLNNFVIGDHQFTNTDESLLTLYDQSIVKFSTQISNGNSYEYHDGRININFEALFVVTYLKDHNINEDNKNPKGTTITYIAQIHEPYYMSKLPQKSYYHFLNSDQYIWKPYYPDLLIPGAIAGVIQTSIYGYTPFEITPDYFTNNPYNNFKLT